MSNFRSLIILVPFLCSPFALFAGAEIKIHAGPKDGASVTVGDKTHQIVDSPLEKLDDLKNKGLNKAVDKMTNPYEGAFQNCLLKMQACSVAMQKTICPNWNPEAKTVESKSGDEEADAGDGDAEYNAQQMPCPDGSKANVTMTSVPSVCKIPSNCQEVMQKYVAASMASGVVKSYGLSLLKTVMSNIGHIPGVPNIPLPF